jgi:uncharacterized membrane protein
MRIYLVVQGKSPEKVALGGGVFYLRRCAMNEVLVYVVIINDRHEDIDVEVFSQKEAAISRAKEIARERMDEYEGEDIDDIGGERIFLFEKYSTEDNYVCVAERPLQ